jgi:ATP-dependent Clp protease, protease subunit
MKIRQLLRSANQAARRPVNLVRNQAGEVTIYIYDEISAFWGIAAMDVINALAQVADAAVLHLRINSPGGDVFESQAIQEAIRRFTGKTIAHIDSLAASAATSIALACDEVEISPGAFFMIHNASAGVWGDKADLRKVADLLEKVEGAIVQGYVDKTGKTTEEVVAWMDAETWFTAEEAVAQGFADRLAEAPVKGGTSNTWNLAEIFKNAPAQIADPEPPAVQTPAPPAPADYSTSTQNAGRLAAAGELDLRQLAASRVAQPNQTV